MRVDRAVAVLAQMYGNVHRDPKKRPDPYTLWDFTPHEEEPPISFETAMESWN